MASSNWKLETEYTATCLPNRQQSGIDTIPIGPIDGSHAAKQTVRQQNRIALVDLPRPVGDRVNSIKLIPSSWYD